MRALIRDAAEASERFGDDECERFAAELSRIPPPKPDYIRRPLPPRKPVKFTSQEKP